MIDAYLKLKGIKGECVDKQFLGKGVIQLLSCTVNGDSAPEGAGGEPVREQVGGTGAWMEQTSERRFISQGTGGTGGTGGPGLTTTKPPILLPEVWPFSFDITKTTDTATGQLFQKFCQYKTLSSESGNASNTVIESAKLWVRKSGGTKKDGFPLTYFLWEFRILQVTAFNWTSQTDGSVQENVSFRFGQCQMTYTPQTTAGKAGVGEPLASPWDLQQNTNAFTAVADSDVLG
jgi:type VI protein secretion system component Hcp